MYYNLISHEGNREATLQRFQQKAHSEFNQLEYLNCPTLILWGENDSWIPVSHAHRFNNILPKSSLIIYDDAGHVPMEVIPVKTEEDAIGFLKITKN